MQGSKRFAFSARPLWIEHHAPTEDWSRKKLAHRVV